MSNKVQYVRTRSGKCLIVADFQSLKSAVRAYYEELGEDNSVVTRWEGWPGFLDNILNAADLPTLRQTVSDVLARFVFVSPMIDEGWLTMPDWLSGEHPAGQPADSE